MASTLQLAVFALLVTITLGSPVSNISRAEVSKRCTHAGIYCLDCYTLALCVDLENKFLEYKKAECTETQPCSPSLKACSSKASICTNPDPDLRYFECVQEGTFPDPYDCNMYHECGDSDDAEYPATNSYTCDENTAFNPKTGECDLSADVASCGENSYPTEKCEPDDFRMDALALDPHYYSICVNETIHIVKCKEGTIFKGSRCVPENGEEPSEETSEDSEEPPSGGFKCAGEGKEADPQSCTRFYDCADPKQPIRFACPWPQYFHQRKARCVLGLCPY